MSFSGAKGKGKQVASGGKLGQGGADGGKRPNRDEKMKKARESLGTGEKREVSGSAPIRSKTHLLIVNGGGHNAFMGDFLGLVEYFEGREPQRRVSPNFAGEYWTALHPAEYFEKEVIKNRGITDIKFNERVVLTKFEALHRAHYWEHVQPTDMLRKIYQWIDLKVDSNDPNGAKAGDSVIMIFLAHGNDAMLTPEDPVEGLWVGHPDKSQILLVNNFVASIRRFPPAIQINVLSNGCASGNFATKIQNDGQHNRWVLTAAHQGQRAWPTKKSVSGRFRDSVFIPAYIRSLGSLRSTAPFESPTITKVRADIEAAVTDPTIAFDGQTSNTAAFHTAPPDTRAASLLIRSLADFPMLAENTNAARRRELSMAYLTREVPDNVHSTDVSFCIGAIDEITRKFGTEHWPYIEGDFPDLAQNPRWGLDDAFRGLLYRGRLQSNAFQVFLQLVSENVCSVSSLAYPINYNITHLSPAVNWIASVIACWTLNRGKYDGVQGNVVIKNQNFRWISFSTHIHWLAIMIARSATSLSAAFKVITDTKYFGRFDFEAWSRLEPFPEPQWEPNLECCRGRGDGPSGGGVYGIMLPAGMEVDESTYSQVQLNFWRNFDPLEKAFEKFFQIPANQCFSLGNQPERDTDPREWAPSIFS